MEQAHQENYSQILPVFIYGDDVARSTANGNMDRTIEKAAKAVKLHSITRKPKRKKGNRSQSYKDFRKKKEYNNWIDDCYLMLGKAQFYKKDYDHALRTFRFFIREYPDSDLKMEIQFWWARVLVDKGDYGSALSLLQRLASETTLDTQLKKQVYGVMADAYIRMNQLEEAIPQLQQALSMEKRKYTKSRYRYILAQLFQRTGQTQRATMAFRALAKKSSSYEMAFNARISQALSYDGSGGGDQIRKELSKMLHDIKNKEYQDQIYYALGQMDMKDENIAQGMDNYWESTRKSVSNDNQKALSFLKLGDQYFKELNYKSAQQCYDSSMIYLNQNYPDYDILSTRVGNLTELVNNLNMVEREDSLQNVARMTPANRDALISGIIAQIIQKEKLKREQERENMVDRSFFNQNNMLGSRGSSTQSQGNWYFYNPTNVGIGKADFQRKWGKRRLEDHWRRKNKSVIEEIPDAEQEIAEDQQIKKSSAKTNIKSKEYYLTDLPLSDSLMLISHERIMKGLYQAGLVYEEQLQDKKAALDVMEDLIHRYPQSPYLLSTYYHCYSLNKSMGNMTKAQFYKSRIVSEFADSDYAHALTDANYYQKVEAESEKVNQMYLRVFQDYQNFYYDRVVRGCDEALRRFPESELRSRFLLLKALGIGHTQGVDSFKEALNSVLKVHPPEAISKLVTDILDGIQKGAVPVQYSATAMEQSRQNRLLRHWQFDEPQTPKMQEPESIVSDEAPGIYKFSPEEEHYFVILVDTDDADPNRVLFNISKYNVEQYNNRTFRVDRLSLNKRKVMIIVKGLKDMKDALAYINDIITNVNAFQGLENADYRNFVISSANFDVFLRNQDVGYYLDFYTNKYFGKEKKKVRTDVTTGQKLVPIEKAEVRDNFLFKAEENHKFVLFVPSKKFNINKLRADVYSHDKDYQVLKMVYDSEHQMIVVNNLGNRKEAMEYFHKIVADKNVFGAIGKLDYRNFVISDSNFEIFYVQNYLKRYLDFFQEYYLKDLSSKEEAVTSEVIKDGIYSYKEMTPHYFALVYPKKGVNTKILVSTFAKYNTKNLKVEVQHLDQEREILLVSKMKNKKQAMMYFRAVVTNRQLFDQLEKVDYRNFVISQDNLNVFIKNTDPVIYLSFFKKWYLQ